MKVGAHVSIANGIQNAPHRAKKLGCEIFQIFSRSPQGGKAAPIKEKEANLFLEEAKKEGFESKDWFIHSPYFINLASSNRKIYYGSISALVRELQIAKLTQSAGVVTHIGSDPDFKNQGKNGPAFERIQKGLEKILAEVGKGFPVPLIFEIAAGSGNIIGDSLEEIALILQSAQKIGLESGFCFDTCHAFAAGYDLRQKSDVKDFFKQLDQKIGLNQLKLIHLNDSKTKLGEKVDRHEHLGEGEIGIIGISAVIKKAQEMKIGMILETKHDKIKNDLALAKKIRDNNNE